MNADEMDGIEQTDHELRLLKLGSMKIQIPGARCSLTCHQIFVNVHSSRFWHWWLQSSDSENYERKHGKV